MGANLEQSEVWVYFAYFQEKVLLNSHHF
ncbi:unknown protein [Simkania negevensis Z]|uniref:Uncharacterized protein n=1 Tax=Simkania negevensis (strain ATCC VR-1471 / DSM 27360 / Z) TaxID=331113 RepID=F8L6A1_SIMNZ|nr:unknown protein [Simkania negevensis Z]